jgi:hypothetical protein
VSAASAFRDRLLDLIPIYREPGRRIQRAAGREPAPTSAELAEAACRRWLRGAIPPTNDALTSIAQHLAEPDGELLWELAGDVQSLAAPLGDEALNTTARHAEKCALAALDGRDEECGRAAADCLYSRRADAGDEYLVADVAAVLRAVTAGDRRLRRSPRGGDCSSVRPGRGSRAAHGRENTRENKHGATCVRRVRRSRRIWLGQAMHRYPVS